MEKTKAIFLFLFAAIIIFVAGSLGCYFAIKSFEPRVRLAVEENYAGLQPILGQDSLSVVQGKVAQVDGKVIKIEVAPPQDPFSVWYKEIEITVTPDTKITSGVWDASSAATEGIFLKESPIAFSQIEIGRMVVVVYDSNFSDFSHLTARRIIVGKTR